MTTITKAIAGAVGFAAGFAIAFSIALIRHYRWPLAVVVAFALGLWLA